MSGRPASSPGAADGGGTAFVLGGAGNLGAVQVGMLGALAGAGVVPDLVVGCSVGAINGAAVARDPSAAGVAALESVWTTVSRTDLWPEHLARAPLRLLRGGLSVTGNDELRGVLAANLPATFEELAVGFHCVATDLHTGRARWFDRGPLVEPVLASAALPGVLPPVVIDGATLVDGAAVDVVPVAKAIALGARRVFVLQIKDLHADRRPPRRPLDVVLRTLAIGRNASFLAALDAVPDAVELHVLPVVAWSRGRYDGFSRTAELIGRSRDAAAAHLAAAGVTG